MRKLLSVKRFFIAAIVSCLIGLSGNTFADVSRLENALYQDKISLVSQQIDLLKNRLVQSQNELAKLQRQHDNQDTSRPNFQINKQSLNQARLDIAVAKSNVDSINIELSESQQTINRLEKDTQEIENQLNVYNIFGLKLERNGAPNRNDLKQELDYQKNLLQVEKTRLDYLQKLQGFAHSSLQL